MITVQKTLLCVAMCSAMHLVMGERKTTSNIDTLIKEIYKNDIPKLAQQCLAITKGEGLKKIIDTKIAQRKDQEKASAAKRKQATGSTYKPYSASRSYPGGSGGYPRPQGPRSGGFGFSGGSHHDGQWGPSSWSGTTPSRSSFSYPHDSSHSYKDTTSQSPSSPKSPSTLSHGISDTKKKKDDKKAQPHINVIENKTHELTSNLAKWNTALQSAKEETIKKIKDADEFDQLYALFTSREEALNALSPQAKEEKIKTFKEREAKHWKDFFEKEDLTDKSKPYKNVTNGDNKKAYAQKRNKLESFYGLKLKPLPST